jgi:phage baseplate assembly protein V
MTEQNSAIEKLYRRIMLLIGRGRILLSTDDEALQRHQVQLGQMETFNNLSRLSEYGFNSMPPERSECVIVFMGGNRTDGCIIATGNQKYRMRNLESGEVSISDDNGQSVYLSKKGIVIDGGGKPIEIKNTPAITMDSPLVTMSGDCKINGSLDVDQSIHASKNISADGDVSDHGGKTMSGMRGVFNGHGHPGHNKPPTQSQ